mmetsp:Transcript_24361/g.73106  ORF Transcript_24361/g.73106 Transcript_24361/m.73106 type:complete len:226 (+) Transcript_24361:586-1263(+)
MRLFASGPSDLTLPTVTRTKSGFRNSAAMACTSGGHVAENMHVSFEASEHAPAMVRTASIKPMSSMRSASSKQRNLTLDRSTVPSWQKSLRRPGVATSAAQPLGARRSRANDASAATAVPPSQDGAMTSARGLTRARSARSDRPSQRPSRPAIRTTRHWTSRRTSRRSKRTGTSSSPGASSYATSTIWRGAPGASAAASAAASTAGAGAASSGAGAGAALPARSP